MVIAGTLLIDVFLLQSHAFPTEESKDGSSSAPNHWNWSCDDCGADNCGPRFAGYSDFARRAVSGSSLKPAAILPHVKCTECSAIRRWKCEHASCGAMVPIVIVKPGGRVVPWMSCLSCGQFKCKLWMCMKCGMSNGPERAGRTSGECLGLTRVGRIE